jgi:hypothetical protein
MVGEGSDGRSRTLAWLYMAALSSACTRSFNTPYQPTKSEPRRETTEANTNPFEFADQGFVGTHQIHDRLLFFDHCHRLFSFQCGNFLCVVCTTHSVSAVLSQRRSTNLVVQHANGRKHVQHMRSKVWNLCHRIEFEVQNLQSRTGVQLFEFTDGCNLAKIQRSEPFPAVGTETYKIVCDRQHPQGGELTDASQSDNRIVAEKQGLNGSEPIRQLIDL